MHRRAAPARRNGNEHAQQRRHSRRPLLPGGDAEGAAVRRRRAAFCTTSAGSTPCRTSAVESSSSLRRSPRCPTWIPCWHWDRPTAPKAWRSSGPISCASASRTCRRTRPSGPRGPDDSRRKRSYALCSGSPRRPAPSSCATRASAGAISGLTARSRYVSSARRSRHERWSMPRDSTRTMYRRPLAESRSRSTRFGESTPN